MSSRAGLCLMAALVLMSCATASSVASTPPPAATSPVPAQVEEPDDGRVELTGHVLGHEGMSNHRYPKHESDPDRLLRRDEPFPAFDFAALHEGDPRIKSTDRSGRVYLIEFWATWCGPCVEEMPTLHAAYAAINGAKSGKGPGEEAIRRLQPAKQPRVEFVFISFDLEPSQVDAFREEHWSMPWTHGFVGSKGYREVMERYGLYGVPTAVLIDETGTILEVESALRGDELLPTLQRVLAERSAAAP